MFLLDYLRYSYDVLCTSMAGPCLVLHAKEAGQNLHLLMRLAQDVLIRKVVVSNPLWGAHTAASITGGWFE